MATFRADRHRRGLARPAHSRRQPRVQFRPAQRCGRLRASHRPHCARRRRGRRHQFRLRGVRDLAAGHRKLHRASNSARRDRSGRFGGSHGPAARRVARARTPPRPIPRRRPVRRRPPRWFRRATRRRQKQRPPPRPPQFPAGALAPAPTAPTATPVTPASTAAPTRCGRHAPATPGGYGPRCRGCGGPRPKRSREAQKAARAGRRRRPCGRRAQSRDRRTRPNLGCLNLALKFALKPD